MANGELDFTGLVQANEFMFSSLFEVPLISKVFEVPLAMFLIAVLIKFKEIKNCLQSAYLLQTACVSK